MGLEIRSTTLGQTAPSTASISREAGPKSGDGAIRVPSLRRPAPDAPPEGRIRLTRVQPGREVRKACRRARWPPTVDEKGTPMTRTNSLSSSIRVLLLASTAHGFRGSAFAQQPPAEGRAAGRRAAMSSSLSAAQIVGAQPTDACRLPSSARRSSTPSPPHRATICSGPSRSWAMSRSIPRAPSAA
jgi:hypothetical protein